MPKRSSVAVLLPDLLRAELDRRLIDGAFSDYRNLADWLSNEGYEISKSSIHRYGQRLEEKISAIKAATEQAKAITEAAGDDENALGEALTRLAQSKAFDVLIDMEAPESVPFPQMVRAIADLNRSGIAVKKHRAEVLEEIKAKLEKLELENTNKTGALDTNTLKRVREEIYGIY